MQRKLLYSTGQLLVILCAVVALIAPTAAQYRKARHESKLRALGLLEFGPKNKVRLIPITIFVEGKFYDAAIYHATPVPMALEPGTVYEAFKTGTPVGLFTISQPETLAGNWRAQGTWKLEGATATASKKTARATSAKKEDDDRPVLRRPGSSSPPSASQPASTSPAPTQPSAPPPSKAPSPSATTEGNTGKTPAREPSADEGGRPTLRRGKAGEEQADAIPEPGSPRPTPAKATTTPSAQASTNAPFALPGQTLAAISDAEPSEYHPYTFELRPQEREGYTKKVSEMAAAAIEKFEKSRDPHYSSCALENPFIQAFDPDYSNEPDLVMSGHCVLHSNESGAARRTAKRDEPTGEKTREAWVTVVARVDLYGEPRQLFASVTDSRHLDEVPRLELIDAVDADGDGRADLLFREINDSGRAFVVYRIGADKLYPLFEGGSGQ
jgi:hypothetical protein